jgi:hypothetical protein
VRSPAPAKIARLRLLSVLNDSLLLASLRLGDFASTAHHFERRRVGRGRRGRRPTQPRVDRTSPFGLRGGKIDALRAGSPKCWRDGSCSDRCSRKVAHREQNVHKLLGEAQALCDAAGRSVGQGRPEAYPTGQGCRACSAVTRSLKTRRMENVLAAAERTGRCYCATSNASNLTRSIDARGAAQSLSGQAIATKVDVASSPKKVWSIGVVRFATSRPMVAVFPDRRDAYPTAAVMHNVHKMHSVAGSRIGARCCRDGSCGESPAAKKKFARRACREPRIARRTRMGQKADVTAERDDY